MVRSPNDQPSRIIHHRDCRQVKDSRGRHWEVFEDVGYSDRSLIFLTQGLMRRVRAFPEDWREIPDGELAALAEKT